MAPDEALDKVETIAVSCALEGREKPPEAGPSPLFTPSQKARVSTTGPSRDRPASPTTEERISWDDLRFIEALDRLGSIRRASRELATSVSTVYRRIAVLEGLVGARCVETGAAGGRLTETGRALAAIARRVESSLSEVAQQVRSAAKDVSGEVSLTTTEGFIPLITPPLAQLCERYPHLKVALHIADQGPSVRRREVDVAISLIPSPPPSLEGRRLFTIRYGVFGTAAAAQATPLRWLVGGSPVSNPGQAEWEKEHVTSVAVRTTSLAATLALVRTGAGVAILPQRLARLEPTLVEVERYSAVMGSLDRTAWILTHPDIQAAPRVRVLLDALIAALT